MAVKTTTLVFIGVLAIGGVARAQEPPPTPPPTVPVQPPVIPVQPPVTPPATPPATPAEPAEKSVVTPPAPPPVRLSETELRGRRDAIFIMEGALSRAIDLAAASTQREIEALEPRVRFTLFSPIRPSAYGTYLEDYGVFFQVQIPTYVPSAVSIVRDLRDLRDTRPGIDPAQPAALTAPARGNAPFDPDALYVDAVRRYLIDAMLKTGRSLDLHPQEWLTVSARGAETTDPAGPSIMVLRLKASDLNDFLAGRVTSEEVNKRIQVMGFSSRR